MRCYHNSLGSPICFRLILLDSDPNDSVDNTVVNSKTPLLHLQRNRSPSSWHLFCRVSMTIATSRRKAAVLFILAQHVGLRIRQRLRSFDPFYVKHSRRPGFSSPHTRKTQAIESIESSTSISTIDKSVG